MASFKGEYHHSVDTKGRVSFPAKLRKYLSPEAQERFTILKGLDSCLWLYPEDLWTGVEKKINRASTFRKKSRQAIRQFLRTADDLQLDNQNRIALPAPLMKMAGITDKAVFIGSGDHIEIWSPEYLAEEDGELESGSYEQIVEEVMTDIEESEGL